MTLSQGQVHVTLSQGQVHMTLSEGHNGFKRRPQ